MQKFAVIDIGSNSVRLMFVADGNVLYKRLCTTRLGEGLATSSTLKADAISRTARAVADFYFQAQDAGAEKVYAYATAAVRSAENGLAFTSTVQDLCGINVEIINGETEALLGAIGALGQKDGAMVDVGGASTEIVVQNDGKLVYKKSVDVGVVRLKDLCGEDKENLFAVAKEKSALFGQVPAIPVCHAVGGTATTLGAIYLGLSFYQPDKITGAEITRNAMAELVERLLAMSVEEIAVLPCVSAGRADVLKGGAVWLYTLMQTLGIEKLVVSDKDNLEGYACWKGLL